MYAAEAALAAARQDLIAAIAKLKESQAVNDRMQADFQRYQTLLDKKEVSRAEYDPIQGHRPRRSYKLWLLTRQELTGLPGPSTRDSLSLTSKEVNCSRHGTAPRCEWPSVKLISRANMPTPKPLKPAYEKADLNVQYGKISAPVAGVVTERSAEPGGRVSSGQQLLMIVETGRSLGHRKLQRNAARTYASRAAREGLCGCVA